MSKTIKAIWNGITWLLITLVVILAIMLAGVRLVGFTPYTVLSGSMEPTYQVGSLIYVKGVAPQDVQVGDPITFILNENLVVATHRVIEIDAENQYFFTKGDANDSPDSAPVHFNNLIGKPMFTIPMLGYFSNWVTNPPGMYIGICGGVILAIMFLLPDLLEKAEEADRKAKQAEASKPQEGDPPQ